MNDSNEFSEYSVAELLLNASFWKTEPEADLREGLAMGVKKMPQTFNPAAGDCKGLPYDWPVTPLAGTLCLRGTSPRRYCTAFGSMRLSTSSRRMK
jgi:hypothetical protein